MKALMLSTDEKILEEGTEVRKRMRWYGELMEEMHIIVLTQNSKLKTQKFGNVFVYPTNSWSKIFCLFDAYRIGKDIIEKSLSASWRTNSFPYGKSLEEGQLLITAQDPFETGLIGFLLKRKFKLPLQVQVHTDFSSPYFWKESFKNRIRILLAKFLIPKADGVRVVSERIKKSLITIRQPADKSISWRTKISVLPIFVDVEKIRNTPIKTDLHKKYPEYDFIILMASRLTKEKNIGLAIEAMQEVVKQYPKTLLLIVGSGPRETNLRQMTNDPLLTDSVKFEKWISDIISYYKTADLFLLTSNYEGYGMAAVEAAASDLPVVTTDVGVSIGRVVPAGDARLLADALNFLIQNKDEREELVKRQSKHFESWQTKEEYLRQMKKLWQECFS